VLPAASDLGPPGFRPFRRAILPAYVNSPPPPPVFFSSIFETSGLGTASFSESTTLKHRRDLGDLVGMAAWRSRAHAFHKIQGPQPRTGWVWRSGAGRGRPGPERNVKLQPRRRAPGSKARSSLARAWRVVGLPWSWASPLRSAPNIELGHQPGGLHIGDNVKMDATGCRNLTRRTAA